MFAFELKTVDYLLYVDTGNVLCYKARNLLANFVWHILLANMSQVFVLCLTGFHY